MNIVFINDPGQVPETLALPKVDGVAVDEGSGVRCHCVVYCKDVPATHKISKGRDPHLSLYNVGSKHSVTFADGVTIDSPLLRELFCSANGFSVTDNRHQKVLA